MKFLFDGKLLFYVILFDLHMCFIWMAFAILQFYGILILLLIMCHLWDAYAIRQVWFMLDEGVMIVALWLGWFSMYRSWGFSLIAVYGLLVIWVLYWCSQKCYLVIVNMIKSTLVFGMEHSWYDMSTAHCAIITGDFWSRKEGRRNAF